MRALLLLLLAVAACQGERPACEPCDADRDCVEGLVCTKAEAGGGVCLEPCNPEENACAADLECSPEGSCVPIDAPDPDDPDAPGDFGCAAYLALQN